MSIVSSTALREVARAFSLKTATDLEMFDDLWEVFQVGNKYRRDHEDDLAAAVRNAYQGLTDIVSGAKTGAPHGLERVARTRADKLVIFSDHHMTHRGNRHDYFFRFNASLYSAVLERYAGDGFTLVENGDVEELVIFEPTKAEAAARRKLVRRPLLIDDIGTIDWKELAGERLETRRQDLERIVTENATYYASVKKFGRDRYIKLSGNHDRYASSILRGMIESVYWKDVVKDVLLVDRPLAGSGSRHVPSFVVTHGHQFDHVCVPPHADECGETISECIAWAFQGPDRIWKLSDTRKWIGTGEKTFSNVLSAISEKPISTPNPVLEQFLEMLMSHEIAWEYFENDNPYDAFVREVCTGDEFFKYRHMDEEKLATALLPKWAALDRFPALICGHTHEVRDRARFSNGAAAKYALARKPVPKTAMTPDTDDPDIYTRYLNTGSAGRFENLIWGVEIEGATARVVSWTNTGAGSVKLKKTAWRSDDRGRLIGRDV